MTVDDFILLAMLCVIAVLVMLCSCTKVIPIPKELNDCYEIVHEQETLITMCEDSVKDMETLADVLKEKLDFYDFEIFKRGQVIKEERHLNRTLTDRITDLEQLIESQ